MNIKVTEFFIDIISKVPVKEPSKEKFTKSLASFDELKLAKEESVRIFDEAIKLTQKEPQLFVDLIRDLMQNNQAVTPIFIQHGLSYNQDQNSGNRNFIDKLRAISQFWESAELLKFQAYLLSGGRKQISALNNAANILPNFKFLGLSKMELNTIRKLRNAYSHSYSVDLQWIIDNQGEKVCKIEDLDLILEKCDFITKWCVQNLMLLFWTNPDLSRLAFYTIKQELIERPSSYQSYTNTIFNLIGERKEGQVSNDSAKEEVPLLAKWITKGWQNLKNPKSLVVNFAGKFFLKGFKPKVDLTPENVRRLLSEIQSLGYEFTKRMPALSGRLSDQMDKRKMKIMARKLMEETSKPIPKDIEDLEGLRELLIKRARQL